MQNVGPDVDEAHMMHAEARLHPDVAIRERARQNV